MQFGQLKRREFIWLLGGAAVAWPRAARAQQFPVIGFLSAGSFSEFTVQMTGFQKGLAESGYIDGQSVKIEYRWADGRYERLPALAKDLVQRKVSLISANPSNAATAAKAATTTIPIVFTSGYDPVRLGLVEAMNRPGGNATGVSQLSGELAAKRLALLRQLVPGRSLIGFLVNPSNLNARYDTDDVLILLHHKA